jgi:hypothetical protein
MIAGVAGPPRRPRACLRTRIGLSIGAQMIPERKLGRPCPRIERDFCARSGPYPRRPVARTMTSRSVSRRASDTPPCLTASVRFRFDSASYLSREQSRTADDRIDAARFDDGEVGWAASPFSTRPYAADSTATRGRVYPGNVDSIAGPRPRHPRPHLRAHPEPEGDHPGTRSDARRGS